MDGIASRAALDQLKHLSSALLPNDVPETSKLSRKTSSGSPISRSFSAAGTTSSSRMGCGMFCLLWKQGIFGVFIKPRSMPETFCKISQSLPESPMDRHTCQALDPRRLQAGNLFSAMPGHARPATYAYSAATVLVYVSSMRQTQLLQAKPHHLRAVSIEDKVLMI